MVFFYISSIPINIAWHFNAILLSEIQPPPLSLFIINRATKTITALGYSPKRESLGVEAILDQKQQEEQFWTYSHSRKPKLAVRAL